MKRFEEEQDLSLEKIIQEIEDCDRLAQIEMGIGIFEKYKDWIINYDFVFLCDFMLNYRVFIFKCFHTVSMISK